MQLIIPVQVDYGAQEFLWYSSFNNIEDIILWWEDQEDIDIYKYKTELHCHTFPASGCADFKPEEVVEIYAKNGYNAVVITNHFAPGILNYEDKSIYIKKFLFDYNEALKAGREYNRPVH